MKRQREGHDMNDLVRLARPEEVRPMAAHTAEVRRVLDWRKKVSAAKAQGFRIGLGMGAVIGAGIAVAAGWIW